MESRNLTVQAGRVPVRVEMRDYVAIGVRWRWRVVFAFVATLAIALLLAFSMPRDYESVMKILVKRERVDPLVAPDQTQAAAPKDISEEELSSEIELLRSEDVLRKVVLATGLQKRAGEPLWFRLSRNRVGSTEEVKTAKAIRSLADGLRISLPKKSTVITVAYRSREPRFAADVLEKLSKRYVEKHMAVHRAPGQVEFFAQQAEECRRKLADLKAGMSETSRKGGTIEAKMELDMAVQKLAELRLTLQQTQMAIGETQKRISSLDSEMGSTPPRMTTAVRVSDNPQLMMQLKGTLLNLELKRTELLQKFQPAYPAVKEVEQEIARTESSIAAAERAPMRDQTTDRDPTYEWLRSESAKSRTELDALQTRADSVAKYVKEYEAKAEKLNERTLEQQDMLSAIAALEDTYRLYLRKREEARISDALDQRKILNVSIAQEPTIPVLPARSPWTLAMGGLVMAILIGVAAGLGSEYMDNSFRNPEEVQSFLDIPVIASLTPGESASDPPVGLR